jgi:hypothetical protein
LEAVMFGAHLWCAVTPSGQAEALTHEPPPRVTSPRGQLTLLHQPPLPAYVPAPDVDAHRSSLQPLAWTAARWAARPSIRQPGHHLWHTRLLRRPPTARVPVGCPGHQASSSTMRLWAASIRVKIAGTFSWVLPCSCSGRSSLLTSRAAIDRLCITLASVDVRTHVRNPGNPVAPQ